HWVVLRLDGELVAFADRCPHRLAPLSIGGTIDTPAGDRLRCGYHGWEFDHTGACTRIPAVGDAATIPERARLDRPAAVQERYGLVWLAPDEPVTGLPDFWEWDDPTFDTCWNDPRPTAAGAGQLCDNFLDAAHLPVVHTGTFGVPGADELPPEPVSHGHWTASTTYRVTYRNHDDPLVATGEHPLEQPQDLYKEVRPATTALIRLVFPLTGKALAILFSCLPVDAERTVVFKMMARNDFAGDGERLAASLAFEDLVLDEDLAVLEAYRSTALPIDPTVEVSTRVDRLSVAYRRLLGELVARNQTPAGAANEP
ncbi:MAG: aromatic ring-hydroxylating dioxygenase subunit alpha, partial [Actinomycetota bacterium]